MTRAQASLTLLAALACSPAASAGFEGRYKFTKEADCAVDGQFLRIEEGVFYGAESQCVMANPVNVRDMKAQLFDMTCTGEGSAWTERAMFMEGAEGGLVLVWNGYAFQYDRCPE
ncbi:hypothetical protein IV417_08035 [Alphaproteobacteria bacterium KMM 3653]|uniref:Uncharacterized protein n=1 Tax=Harenicola maris TaxID=2841044 RepID=A0AAP2CPN8_9RHOB|nr:hypothetical protein [Harenicola maris]